MIRKHKNKVIATVVILAALSIAWFWGGNYNKRDTSSAQDAVAQTDESLSRLGETSSFSETSKTTSETDETVSLPPLGSDNSIVENMEHVESSDRPFEEQDALSGAELPENDEEQSESETTQGDSASTESPSSSSEMDINPDTGLDRYQTSQVPDDRPAPVEPEDMVTGDDSFTVTLVVRCDTILANMNLLNREKHELVPDDGVIFPATTITAYEGESVFNILQREMRRAGIHMTFRNTPIYNSAYIEAINNLYEFDVGELSGWMYKVNGWFPNYGSSRYQLQPGDVIEWHYTCDLGHDLGEYMLGGSLGQEDS